MNALMLEGWTPILLFGTVFAIGMFIMARKFSRKLLFSIYTVLTLICIGVIIYSVISVGGWEGMGLGFYTFSAMGGILMGTAIGIV
ncbi:YesK family protein [Virgibacillus necropolis]|uniref:Sodium:dicarboxylate symporter n=1 Tax=Virgibacillus necropolis TaxID=163877 RepID=A0A221MCM3_9BACI|nr:YesK family protein [Virgibacillus necropolis]ASN05384.1 sodium:dicarboxylate symporter [Virgibacillus necropolis]